jgi:hypothetical protein
MRGDEPQLWRVEAAASLADGHGELIDALQACGEHPLSIDELAQRGIQRPGEGIYELQLAGYPIERIGPSRRGSALPRYRLPAR